MIRLKEFQTLVKEERTHVSALSKNANNGQWSQVVREAEELQNVANLLEHETGAGLIASKQTSGNDSKDE